MAYSYCWCCDTPSVVYIGGLMYKESDAPGPASKYSIIRQYSLSGDFQWEYVFSDLVEPTPRLYAGGETPINAAVAGDSSVYVGLNMLFSAAEPKYNLWKLNSDGTVAWATAVGDNDCSSVALDEENGYGYAANARQSDGPAFHKFSLEDGSLVASGNWPVSFGATGASSAYATAYDGDGTVYVGFRGSPDGGRLARLDANNGNVLEHYPLPGGAGQFAVGNIMIGSSGDIYLVDWTSARNRPNVFRVQVDGTIVWSKHLDYGAVAGAAQLITEDGVDYILKGAKEIGLENDGNIQKIDEDGNVSWDVNLGTRASCKALAVINSDHDFVALCHVSVPDTDPSDPPIESREWRLYNTDGTELGTGNWPISGDFHGWHEVPQGCCASGM